MVNKSLLEQMIEQKFVSVRKHPEANLFIYNYTSKTQYENAWNEVTSITRGLILDNKKRFVARPFPKFFNLEQHQKIPKQPFEVFEKLDGSLGILYWLDDRPYMATRGSFTSEQAIHASNVLRSKYSHTFNKLDKDKTYLFEIIYPENKVVVDYAGLDDIILLAIIDTKTGLDLPIIDLGFPIVKSYNGITDIKIINTLAEDNKEGFVLLFKNGFRVKIKFPEYVRLHKILTQASSKTVWEHLKDDRPFGELIECVPDEFYDWLTATKSKLEADYQTIYDKALSAYKQHYNDDKKTFALNILKEFKDIASIIFALYDNKEYEQKIWKMVKPTWTKPFKEVEES